MALDSCYLLPNWQHPTRDLTLLCVSRELELLKPRLKAPNIDKKALKELLVRLLYVEMLGHDASWGYVKALQACSEANLHVKKVCSLHQMTCIMCMQSSHEARVVRACVKYVCQVHDRQAGCSAYQACRRWKG